MDLAEVEHLILNDDYDSILERSIELVAKAQAHHDIVIIEGVELNARNPFTEKLNLDLASTFQSGLIFAGNAGANSLCQIGEYLNFYIKRFAGLKNWLAGYIANKMVDESLSDVENACQVLTDEKITCLGLIADNKQLTDIKDTVSFIASSLQVNSLVERLNALEMQSITTPAFFKYRLMEKARQAKQRIVLPEGDEPRTLKAALICHDRQLAHCVLLGDRTKSKRSQRKKAYFYRIL